MSKTPSGFNNKPPYLQYTLIVALLFFLGYQQSLITDLKKAQKELNSQQLALSQRVQELESRNDWLNNLLKQIDSRLGYMDSKVTETIEARSKRHIPSQIERPTDNQGQEAHAIHPDEDPHAEKGGFLGGLRRIFGN